MGEGHRLHLVVGHVDRGHPQLVLHVLELRAHVAAKLRVEVGERLVHQERGGPAHDRPREGDPLPLPAGELTRVALQQILHVDLGRRLAHRRRPLVRPESPHLERKADVLRHRLVRVERVGLKHHRDVPVLGKLVGDVRVAEEHLPRIGGLEPRDDPERGRLAAPGRSEQDQELARLDREAELLHHVVGAEPLVEPPKREPPGAGARGRASGRTAAARRRPVARRRPDPAHPSFIPGSSTALRASARPPLVPLVPPPAAAAPPRSPPVHPPLAVRPSSRRPLIPSPPRAGSPSR